MKTYVTVAVENRTGRKVFIEMECPTKKALISELHVNGYHPYRGVVEEKSIYDEWLNTTNETIEELREIKRKRCNK